MKSRQAAWLRAQSLRSLQALADRLPVVVADTGALWEVLRTDGGVAIRTARYQVASAFLQGFRDGYDAGTGGRDHNGECLTCDEMIPFHAPDCPRAPKATP